VLFVSISDSPWRGKYDGAHMRLHCTMVNGRGQMGGYPIRWYRPITAPGIEARKGGELWAPWEKRLFGDRPQLRRIVHGPSHAARNVEDEAKKNLRGIAS
jgi:hypothetical protein